MRKAQCLVQLKEDEKTLFRKDLTNIIRASNETFAKALLQINSSMAMVTQSHQGLLSS